MVYIDYGVTLFRRAVLDMIPEDRFYPLEELFPRLIDRQEMMAFEVEDRFHEIGSPGGLMEFREYVKRGKS
jgi:NDP-sugar pyrophosphorylase family protein